MNNKIFAENLLANRHHARFHQEDVIYHIISRTFQGRLLLKPCEKLNNIIAGVIGRAQTIYPDVELFAFAVMSNHLHLILRGKPQELPAFIGFIKREISRRWGPNVKWPGNMWEEYYSTALPSEKYQQKCFEYVLSQGVKEGLVERAEQWPGFHCAKYFTKGTTLSGKWFNGTDYSIAKSRELQKAPCKRSKVRKREYWIEYPIKTTRLPAYTKVKDNEFCQDIKSQLNEIAEKYRKERKGAPVKGIKYVKKMPINTRSPLPTIPWLKRDKKMICWGNIREPLVKAYLEIYWDFQAAFREAADKFNPSGFPKGAFVPMQCVT